MLRKAGQDRSGRRQTGGIACAASAVEGVPCFNESVAALRGDHDRVSACFCLLL